MLHKYKECTKCGKRFLVVRESDFCPACRVKEDKDFAKVKEFIYDNPSANLAEISDATEVAETEIVRWQEEGKIRDDIREALRCEVCGKAIKNGRICERCQRGLSPDDRDEVTEEKYVTGLMHHPSRRHK